MRRQSMKKLLLVASGLGAVIATALPSAAAPSYAGPACKVVSDAAGDESFYGDTAGSPNDAALDLLGATLRSDGRTLHARVTVAGLSARAAAGSRSWVLNFGVENRGYALQALQSVDGVSFAAYGPGDNSAKPRLGSIAGSFDVASNTIVMDAPLSLLGVDRQARFLDFSAVAGHGFGTTNKGPAGPQDVTSEADSAAGHASYRLDRGCR